MTAVLPVCFMTWSHVVSMLPDGVDGWDIERITSCMDKVRGCASVVIFLEASTEYRVDMPMDEWFVQPWVVADKAVLKSAHERG